MKMSPPPPPLPRQGKINHHHSGPLKVCQIFWVIFVLDSKISKILIVYAFYIKQDQSKYTVTFNDGDIAQLRRNALRLKSGKHFNPSESLDNLPLTHPEHFSTPVGGNKTPGGGGGRRLTLPSSPPSRKAENRGGCQPCDASRGSLGRRRVSQSVGRSVGLSGCYWARSEAGGREEYVLLCTKVNTNLILCTSPPSLNTE